MCQALYQDFPGGSDGKASVYNAGDLGSIPGLGRSPGEGNGNPLQYYCLENLMDRGAWQDHLEKEMAIHSSTIAWKIPWTEEPGRLQSHGVAKSPTRLSNFTFTFRHYTKFFTCNLISLYISAMRQMLLLSSHYLYKAIKSSRS